jgi:hypothetical protein
MTKTPKVLPWIARKAGISDEQITTLWSKAVRRAAPLSRTIHAPIPITLAQRCNTCMNCSSGRGRPYDGGSGELT